MKQLFLTPVDVLYLRGNRLFGEAGDDAGAVMPPWPSVVAGAIRSRMLVDAGADLHAFAKGEAVPETLAVSLGLPEKSGAFRLVRLSLAQQVERRIEPLLPMPSDWLKFSDGLQRLAPCALPETVMSSAATPCLPILRTAKAAKAEARPWLNIAGIRAWLRDETLHDKHLLEQGKLWKTDARLGIGMDADTGSAKEGQIYTSDAVAMCNNAGFLAEVDGADQNLPQQGLLRFGGDGRGVNVQAANVQWPEANWKAIEQHRRFRLLLTSPGIFTDGWRLPGMNEKGECALAGGKARVVAATIGRNEVISGWDVARHQPKAAVRAAAAGSVYWLEDFDGDIDALKRLQGEGLPCDHAMRRAEGFNACLIGNWNKE